MASKDEGAHNSLLKILQVWTTGELPTATELESLEGQLLADQPRAKVFGITSQNVSQVVRARSHLFRSVYSDCNQFCQDVLHWSGCPLEILWDLWLPLATQLAQIRRILNRPLIQGILGGQGTGKTTLAAILTLILKHLGYRTLSLSLDDLYKSYPDRLHLQKEDPRLVWRGPPGTHDVDLGLVVLKKLRHADRTEAVQVPRFDKSAWAGVGDRTSPETVVGIDIVLFEGWFVGARPVDPVKFAVAPPPILTDSDRSFAQDSNTRLKSYLPLWDQLDRLIVLYPSDYRLSQQWRRQAEQQMIMSGKSGMTDTEIDQFVEYFWRSLHPDLFVKPLIKPPATQSSWADLVIEIDADHVPGAVYRPGCKDADLLPPLSP